MVKEFVKICTENEIAEGQVKTFEINDMAIAVARFEGQVYALDDVCTHDGGDLGAGAVVRGQIQCPRHGARFDLKTGAVTQMPAIFPIGTYEVRIENGDVLIAIPS